MTLQLKRARPHPKASPEFSLSDAWRQELASSFGGLTAERHTTDQECASPAGRILASGLGRAGAFGVEGTPQVVRRTRAAVRDADADPLKICIQRSGRAVVRQGSSEVTIGPGQLAVYDTGRPYEIRLDGAWRCMVMTFPRHALGVPERDLHGVMVRRIPVGAGPGQRLVEVLRITLQERDHVPSGSGALEEASLGLVSHLLFGSPVRADMSMDAARARIELYVQTHLDDPELSHASVAAAHHMSVRSLHRLFEDQPASVASLIRTFRLEAIRADLLDPALRSHSLTSIAARWGYDTPAHFTRAFRAQFGVTPGYLRQGRGAGPERM